MFKSIFSQIISVCFVLAALGPLPKAQASVPGLPAPGAMVNLSPAYQPVLIKGLTVHKDNPFLFDFIVDRGQDDLSGEPLKREGEKLIKYFLAGLAIPDKDVWVNLSPYEKDKTIPKVLGRTDMGRDLLEQDYILKQITASLIYPEKQLGKTFWDAVYAKAQKLYGTTRIPVNTFNKVWIMADRAQVFEHGQTAFVVDSHLKVMLEEDYLALTHHQKSQSHSIASQIIRQIILPELEKEVNTGRNFANLRQIFNSIILSSWYKKNLKAALLTQVYADKSRVRGIDLKDPAIQERIYEQYLAAYKKGVFNYIKEETDASGEKIPQKYFSGGMREGAAAADRLSVTTDPGVLGQAMFAAARFTDLVTFFTGAPSDTETISIGGQKFLKANVQTVLEILQGIDGRRDHRPLPENINAMGIVSALNSQMPLQRPYKLYTGNLRGNVQALQEWLAEWKKAEGLDAGDVINQAMLAGWFKKSAPVAIPSYLDGKEIEFRASPAIEKRFSAGDVLKILNGLKIHSTPQRGRISEKIKNAQSIIRGLNSEFPKGLSLIPLTPQHQRIGWEFKGDPLKFHRWLDSWMARRGLSGFLPAAAEDAMITPLSLAMVRKYLDSMRDDARRNLIRPQPDFEQNMRSDFQAVQGYLLKLWPESGPFRVYLKAYWDALEGRLRYFGANGAWEGILEKLEDMERSMPVQKILPADAQVIGQLMSEIENEKSYMNGDGIRAFASHLGIDAFKEIGLDELPYNFQVLSSVGPVSFEDVVYARLNGEKLVRAFLRNNNVVFFLLNVEGNIPSLFPGQVPLMANAAMLSRRDVLKRGMAAAFTDPPFNATFGENGSVRINYLQEAMTAVLDDPNWGGIARTVHSYQIIRDDRLLPAAMTTQYFLSNKLSRTAAVDALMEYAGVTKSTERLKKEKIREKVEAILDAVKQKDLAMSARKYNKHRYMPMRVGRLDKKYAELLAQRPRDPKELPQWRKQVEDLYTKIGRLYRDRAQISKPGGIDLNTQGMQWSISKDGRGVQMNVDPAMIARIKRQGIDSLSPVIFKMTPVSSVWSLVGLPVPSRV